MIPNLVQTELGNSEEDRGFQLLKMAEADSKWGVKKMEGESESVRTVDCLRARLLAERSASRTAKDHALHLENKLMELETMLKKEVESRNRAEKKTKLLLQKLESMGKIGISHPSPTESLGVSENNFPSSAADSGSEGQNGNFVFSEGGANSERSSRSGLDEDKSRVDDSMALVVVDEKPRENRAIDPEVLDSAVKEVLDTLKRAKEGLRRSMEERRVNVIRVG